MWELGRQGFFCSQILMILALEMQGKENPDLVRSMHGLCAGLGAGEVCGALTGGASVLGLYSGKGTPAEEEEPRLLLMLDELVSWFKEEYGQTYGGIRCDEIIGDDGANMTTRCPAMMQGVFQKTKELLVENGFDLVGSEF
jgi:C_GCAxxG_C_C family probable redox protein